MGSVKVCEFCGLQIAWEKLTAFQSESVLPKTDISISIYIYICIYIYISLLLKHGKCSINFLMLLFVNESLTSLVYINIRHKLTG